MHFTPQEMKQIERWRKQEQRWPRTRWVLLAGAALIIMGYAYIAYLLFDALGDKALPENASTLLFALFWPKVLLMVALSSGVLGFVWKNWHGNVNRMLLLKLLDARENENRET